MTAAEVAVVLKMLTAVMPGARIDERTPDVWANACATVDPDVGLVAARRLVASLSSKDRFPTPADFMAWVNVVKHEREPLGLPESTDPALEPDAAKVEIAKAREALDAARKSR